MTPRYWKRHVFKKNIRDIEKAELEYSKMWSHNQSVMIEQTSGGYFRLVKMTPVWK